MRFLMEEDMFNQLQKYVIANNVNSDAGRCNLVEVNIESRNYSLTICFNEKKNQVAICEIFDEDMNEVVANEELIKCCFDELVNIATNITTDNTGLNLHRFYKEKIEPATECCELNQ